MRTVVNLGPLIERLKEGSFADCELAVCERTTLNLYYGFRRRLVSGLWGYVLLQVSRTSGRLAVEVAVSRRDSYPYYRYYDIPRLGVDGFRERVYRINRGRDELVEYCDYKQLRKIFETIVVEQAQVALRRLHELVEPTVRRELSLWNSVYRDWLLTERRQPTGAAGERYSDLVGESKAYSIIHSVLVSGELDRFLGPLKFRYGNPAFLHCHLYLLARGLEVLEPPTRLFETISAGSEAQESVQERRQPLEDGIAGLTGRYPQREAVDWTSVASAQTAFERYAFLKSLAAVEACFSDIPPQEQQLPEVAEIPELSAGSKPRDYDFEELYDSLVSEGDE